MRNYISAIELAIFAVVSLIFINSVYHLFTDNKHATNARRPLSIKTETKAKTATQPLASTEPKNTPVQALDGIVKTETSSYETSCSSEIEKHDTDSEKLRIVGKFCGAKVRKIASVQKVTEPTHLNIENRTAQYKATVFSDARTGKFTTDFIPLDKGKNHIVMEFVYRNGKKIAVRLEVLRN